MNATTARLNIAMLSHVEPPFTAVEAAERLSLDGMERTHVVFVDEPGYPHLRTVNPLAVAADHPIRTAIPGARWQFFLDGEWTPVYTFIGVRVGPETVAN